MQERFISAYTLAKRGGTFTPVEPSPQSYAPSQPNLPQSFPVENFEPGVVPDELSTEQSTPHGSSDPNRGGRNWKTYALAGVTVSAVIYGVMHAGGESSKNDNANISSAHSTQPHKAEKQQAGEKSTAPAASNASESASPGAVSSANALAPVPANVVFNSPGCSETKIQFVNQGDNQSVFPVQWDYMGKDASPFIATGKMEGSMTLNECLTDMSAVKYDADASKRMDNKVVYTVDVSKVKVTPDISDLTNGISLYNKIDTDHKLLKQLRKTDAGATMEDVAAFHAPLDKNVGKIRDLDLLTSLAWIKDRYQTAILQNEQQFIIRSLTKQLADKNYDTDTVVFVPDLTVKPELNYNINEPSSKELEGQFTFSPNEGKLSLIVTDSATGKKLIPEAQP